MTFTDEDAGVCSSLRIAESGGGTDELLNTVSRRKKWMRDLRCTCPSLNTLRKGNVAIWGLYDAALDGRANLKCAYSV
jgi:hypothetical protein